MRTQGLYSLVRVIHDISFRVVQLSYFVLNRSKGGVLEVVVRVVSSLYCVVKVLLRVPRRSN